MIHYLHTNSFKDHPCTMATNESQCSVLCPFQFVQSDNFVAYCNVKWVPLCVQIYIRMGIPGKGHRNRHQFF